MTAVSAPSASQVGLIERVREGWCSGRTGELAPGVRIRSSHTVVDVGCGDGGLIGFCAGQSAEVIFIDRDSHRLAATEERIRKSPARAYRAIASDCDPIPLEDAIADLVICTEVLEHVPDPAAFLRELIRVTRPGGRLLVTVPDARSEQLVAATAPAYYFQAPNHIRIFTAAEFRNLVQAAGLEIREPAGARLLLEPVPHPVLADHRSRRGLGYRHSPSHSGSLDAPLARGAGAPPGRQGERVPE